MNSNVKKTLVLGLFSALVMASATLAATKFSLTKLPNHRCEPAYGYDAGYGYGYGYDCRRITTSSGGGGGSSYVAPTTGNLNTGTVNTGVVLTGENLSGVKLNDETVTFVATEEGKKALESVAQSTYETEWKEAYLFARSLGITTMPTIQEAQLERNLTRAELAKMLSVFTLKFTDKKPVEGKAQCGDFADKNQVNVELQGFIKAACELEIMGLHSDGKTPLANFMPNKFVSRAELVTVLSRVLYGNQFDNNNGSAYWTNHMSKLAGDSIIKVTTPTLEEVRINVFLMMYRMKGK